MRDNQDFKSKHDSFFPIGFNYWPRDSAVYLWEEYNSEAIEREMRIISELGANTIRIFVRWEDLSPKPHKINERFFPKFENFLSHAKNYDIKVIPTLLIGHMSGQDWFPSWFYVNNEQEMHKDTQFQIIDKPPYKKEQCKCRDIYTDPTTLKNSRMQIKALLSRFKENDTILSWDLSNENQYWMQPKTPEIGTNYMKNMYEMMKELDPNHSITYGMGKPDEKSGFVSFGLRGFAQYNDYYCVHVYPEFLYPMTNLITDFYICYRPAYECCLAKVSKKPIQLQEFGISDMFFPGMSKGKRDQLIYGYYNIVLWDLIINEVRGGVLTWDFCDFLPELKNRNPYDHKKFELFFGVVDSDYKMKSTGKAFKRFVNFLQEIDITDFSRVQNQIAVVLPDNFNEFPEVKNKKSLSEDNTLNHSKSLFSAFIYTKMAHHHLDFISLNEFDDSLEDYKVLLLPNLYHLSDKSEEKCVQFLNKPSNRIVYCSSNSYIPSNLFGPLHWKQKKIKSPTLTLMPSNTKFRSSFSPELVLKSQKTLMYPLFIDDNVSKVAVNKDKVNTPLMFSKPYKNDNYALFLTTAPEINNTTFRNSYRKQEAYKLYQGIFYLSRIEKMVDCSNPFIEYGLLSNPSETESLLILINHEFSDQRCSLNLNFRFDKIEEYYSSEFSLDNNKLEFSIPPYGNYVFLIQR
ncbi:MAG: glycoside hydrolase 5 family protein [Promethearchaeota archaeon]